MHVRVRSNNEHSRSRDCSLRRTSFMFYARFTREWKRLKESQNKTTSQYSNQWHRNSIYIISYMLCTFANKTKAKFSIRIDFLAYFLLDSQNHHSRLGLTQTAKAVIIRQLFGIAVCDFNACKRMFELYIVFASGHQMIQSIIDWSYSGILNLHFPSARSPDTIEMTIWPDKQIISRFV